MCLVCALRGVCGISLCLKQGLVVCAYMLAPVVHVSALILSVRGVCACVCCLYVVCVDVSVVLCPVAL